MRKILGLILFLCISLVFQSCEDPNARSADVWDFVPVRSALVLDFNDGFEGILESFQHTFFEIPGNYPFGKEPIHYIQQLFPDGKFDDSWPMPEQLLLAVANSGADRYDVALLFEPGELSLGDLQDQLQLDSWQNQNYSSTSFVESSTDSITWYLTELEGIWFLSTSRLLLEEAIRKAEQNEAPTQNEGLERLIESADKSTDLTLYIQYEEYKSLWKKWFERSSLPNLEGIEGWMSLDVILENDRILFTGILNEQADGVPEVVQGTSNHEFEEQNHIPASAAMWSTKRVPASQLQLDMGSLKSIDAWYDDSQVCGAFFLPVERERQFLLPVFFAGTDSRSARGLLPTSEGLEFSTQLFREVEIVQLNQPLNLSGLVSLDRFDENCRFFCVIDETVYFCNEDDALKRLINELQAGESLEKRFGSQPEEFFPTGDANRHIGFQNPGFAHIIQQFVNGLGMPSINTSEDKLKSIRSGGISILQRSQRTYVKGSLNSGESKSSPIQNNWTISLESAIIAGPYSVKSHREGPTAFIVQDTNYTLYMVNLKGQVDWKVQLDGKILGQPFVVDRYQNDKYQYILNTAGSIYGIDRIGNPLAGFPVKLKTTATAGLAVFDYDKIRKYRILVPSGNTVLNYDVEGNEVSGWMFEAMVDDIVRSPVMIQSGQKDYICFQSKSTMRLTSRTGKSRWGEDLRVDLFPGNQWWGQPTGNPNLDGFTGLDGKGRLVHVFTNGTVDSSKVEANWFRMFDDYAIRQSGNEIEFQMPKRTTTIKKQARWKFIKPLVHKAQFFILALDTKNKELHLFDAAGDEIDGFPVYSEGNFTAGDFYRNGKLQIVTSGSSGSLIDYKIFFNED